jgi:hypothetical protein
MVHSKITLTGTTLFSKPEESGLDACTAHAHIFFMHLCNSCHTATERESQMHLAKKAYQGLGQHELRDQQCLSVTVSSEGEDLPKGMLLP